MKKALKIALILLALTLVRNHLPYYYSNDKTVDFIVSHAEPKSKCSCAGYVMRGMWHGGCPVSLVVLPAYGYARVLPQMGFKEVPTQNYVPRKGDISVLPRNKNHVFGHIAVYDGKQWVSDFKQSQMLCSKTYRAVGKYQIFRIDDGWHWSHLRLSNFLEVPDYVETAFKGYKKIKLL